ncbi:hypothetical protein [Massilia sp. LjRoot122]|uniref:hypothetical protein n=1 Tax=Massilia sp. LjRoot122 TaxID=3342257 RepID=UPI003ECD4396
MNGNTASSSEIDLFEVMALKARTGEPVQVATLVIKPLLRLHLRTITRLRAKTGIPVHVIYN